MVEIKPTKNTSRASDRDPTTDVTCDFINAHDVASSRPTIKDLTAMT